MPFDKNEYNRTKEEALKKKQMSRRDKSWKVQRDASLFMMFKEWGRSYDQIKDGLERYGGVKVSSELIKEAIQRIKDRISNE